MKRAVARVLERRSTVYAACAASVALGLFFIFVWSPLPWGWKGIDLYSEIALELARGEPFPTLDRMWGYPYFLAFWYRVFGDRQWIPLIVQVLLNACIPLMLYHLVRRELGERVAVTSAILAGLFSFNTVYASTQASDSLCTVLVVATMLCLGLGARPSNAERAPRRLAYFGAAGLLAGLAYQFRPNFLLFPAFFASVYLLIRPRSLVKIAQTVAFLALFVLAAAPWIIRNYRWSGLFVPTSTHGGVQLWSGTLQTGQYEHSWIYNPRAAFEDPTLDYTSIDELPLIVTARVVTCDSSSTPRVALVYWTNRDRTANRLDVNPAPDGGLTFTIPRQPSPTALYYYFELDGVMYGLRHRGRVPVEGALAPLMAVISRDHLRDLDVDGFVLDVSDIARLVRALYWSESLPPAGGLDVDGDGRVTERDLRTAIAVLVHDRAAAPEALDEIVTIEPADTVVILHLRDGSAVSVPRQWSGKVTDLPLRTVGVKSMAALVVSRSRPFVGLGSGVAERAADPCLTVTEAGVNRVPYRRLPHEMRRYTALALDNIRHDPAAYLKASARRALRVFVIEGSADIGTAYQFERAGTIYRIGRALSMVYFAVFVVGLGIALARRLQVILLIVPIAYVPITICFMLINARYSMTTQPFAFAFVALALVTALDALSRKPPARPNS